MATAHNSSNSIELNDRILWFDGESSFSPDNIINGILLNCKHLFTSEINDEIRKFNMYSDEQIKIKNSCELPTPEIVIPEKFKNVNVLDFIIKKHETELGPLTESIRSRINYEYGLFSKKNLLDILKICIYIIDVFEKNNVVWGTGRGSACCSYILYIIGIHDVDSILYDLDIHEFLR